MYINKCTKCGAEFETKNPKRVICPNCLYPDRKQSGEVAEQTQAVRAEYPNGYSSSSESGIRDERVMSGRSLKEVITVDMIEKM